MPVTALICDLDGLLTDTETLHYQSYQEIFPEFGFTVSEQDYAEHWIRHGRSISDYVTRHSLSCDPVVIRQRKLDAYLRLVATDVRMMPGVPAFLARVHGRYRLAVASSSTEDSVRPVLTAVGITDRFEVVVSGDQVTRSKPDPEIFLRAAAILGVAPENCVVFEDAEKGVRAAHAAGMRCIAVPNRFTQSSDFSMASLIVSSLDEITLTVLDSLPPR
jgi:putative hydrolase of the HAD superfamily